MYRDIKKGLYLPDIEGIQKTRYVKDMFGSISPRYDFLNWIMTLGMHHKWRQTASDIACMSLSGDASSGLDIASGTGDFAFQVIEHPNVNYVVAMDLSEEMLMIAKRKYEAKKFHDDIDFFVGDVIHMPFSKAMFSFVTVGFGFRNFVDLEGSLREMTRVVKPGGNITILEIVKPEGIFMSKVFPIYFRKLTPILGALFARNVEAYSYLPKSVRNFVTARQIKHMMEIVGLRNVTIKELAMGSVAVISGDKI